MRNRDDVLVATNGVGQPAEHAIKAEPDSRAKDRDKDAGGQRNELVSKRP